MQTALSSVNSFRYEIRMITFKQNIPRSASALLLLLLLSSCGVVRKTAPEENARFISSGIASWYGPNFHGRLTANGEVYNMNDYTAAHRTLPFNTVLLVVNEDNDQSVRVRINDRGPYIDNRIIDLSRKAASEVDMIGSGTAPVRLYVLREGDRPVTDENISSRETFTIQLASFQREAEAISKMDQIPGAHMERVTIEGEDFFRVYFGIFDTAEEARQELIEMEKRGHNGFVKQLQN